MDSRSKLQMSGKSLLALGATLLVLLGGPALAQDAGTPDKDQVVNQPKPYSPYVDQHFPQKVLFGDTHFHSSLSVDSGLIGNTLPLETAIRFAMGEEVRTNGGQRAQLIRPLDFLVLSDHAEYLGIADLLDKADPALLATPEGKAPSFMIVALRDPDNANLDRVQVIKGWLDKDGKTHERIYDVAVSDDREIGADGRCKTPVGSTVNVADASYTNTIGDPMLSAYWKDPDFDSEQRVFYYVRVIEIPKPRWTAHDAKFFKVKMPDNIPMTVQDRAFTSPIWYTP